MRAHVLAIPFENLDIHLGREIHIDLDSIVTKLVDGGRGGYCFEQNALFSQVLESLGFSVTRLLGRVRMGDAVSPRPSTHMTLRVDDRLVDVGFGAATPLGPVPFSGEPVTFGEWTYHIERMTAPEGDDVWALWLGDRLLYTFSDEPRHPVDYVAPNHYTATHPMSRFITGGITVQQANDDVQTVLQGRELSEFRPDGVTVTEVDPADLGAVLRDRFGLQLTPQDLGALSHLLGG